MAGKNLCSVAVPTVLRLIPGRRFLTCLITAALLLSGGVALAKGPPVSTGGGGGGGGHTEVAGNNLSFPVIWAEGVKKTLPGTMGMEPILQGDWWYWWGTEGTDPNIILLSAPPDPDNNVYLDDGFPDSINITLVPGEGWVKAYLQKDIYNVWQAYSGDPIDAGVTNEAGQVVVDWIDWGDSLESVDWYTNSMVRIEVVLFKDKPELTLPWLEYQMRHVSGWGIDEVHGLAVDQDDNILIGPGTQATVYSHCARLTIQKLLVDRNDERLERLTWVPGSGWIDPEGQIINQPIFNQSVYEGGDGPGYYSAEINVKGRIIYGYTWEVRRLNDPAGYTAAGAYRITFSLDETDGDVTLKTFFRADETKILLPLEEVATAEEEPVGGGGKAQLRPDYNLTYIDINILERTSGGKGGSKKRF